MSTPRMMTPRPVATPSSSSAAGTHSVRVLFVVVSTIGVVWTLVVLHAVLVGYGALPAAGLGG